MGRAARSSLLMQVTTASLLVAVSARVRGHGVFYLPDRSIPAWKVRALAGMSAQPVALESQANLDLAPLSWEEPGAALATSIQAWAKTDEWRSIASDAGGTQYASDILGVMALKAAAATHAEAFAAATWARSMHADVSLYSASLWQRLTLSSMDFAGQSVAVRRLPQAAPLSALTGVIRRAVSRGVAAGRREAPVAQSHDVTAQGTGEAAREAQRGSRTDASVLLVLNRGSSYGALYSYDFLLHAHGESPLSWSRAAIISREGGLLENGQWSDPWPTSREHAWSRMRRRLNPRPSKDLPSGVGRFLLDGVARSRQIAATVRARYPRASLAVYAFDAQVPAEMSLAFDMAGIRSAALQERPASALSSSVPVAVETLLTASEYFSRASQRASSIAVRDCREVGMWRTDFLPHGTEPLPGSPARPDRQLVVALPYHVTKGAVSADHPLATSSSTMRSFITDLLRLADTLPDVDFVVRGKNASWLEDPELADIRVLVEASPNLSVSTEYQRLNESYRLCGEASLVIAKHTSLVEECLSVGIPCLLHDYSWNYRDYERMTLEFIPRALWAESYEELEDKASQVLRAQQSTCLTAVAEVRRDVFGTWSDGGVQARARRVLETILREDNGRDVVVLDHESEEPSA